MTTPRILNWSGHVRHRLVGKWVRWNKAPDHLAPVFGRVSAALFRDGRYLLCLRDWCLWVPADECREWK